MFFRARLGAVASNVDARLALCLGAPGRRRPQMPTSMALSRGNESHLKSHAALLARARGEPDNVLQLGY